jgi:hypothetical protein
VEELREENLRLKEELQEALEKTKMANAQLENSRKAAQSISPPSHDFSPLIPPRHGTISPAHDNIIHPNSDHLVEKYHKLYENYQDIKAARDTMEAKLRKAKDDIKSWRDYSNGQQTKIKKLKEKLEIHGVAHARGSSVGHISGTRNSEGSNGQRPGGNIEKSGGIQVNEKTIDTSERGTVFVSSPGTISSGLPQADMAFEPRLDQDLELPRSPRAFMMQTEEVHFPQAKLHNSSSTQGEVEEEERTTPQPDRTIKDESPESPVIVSSRRVKKYRQARNTDSELTPRPTKVKVEDIGSSPAEIDALYGVGESIDLDEVGQRIATPKKKRPSSESGNWISNSRSNKTTSFDAEDMSPAITRKEVAKQHQSQRGESAPAVDVPSGHARQRSALQPKSINKQILPRTSEDRTPKRHREEGYIGALGVFAEDGENFDSSEDKALSPKALKRSRIEKTDHTHRLTGLLEEPSPQRKVLTQSFSPKVTRILRKDETNTARPYISESPIIKQSLQVPAGREPPTEPRTPIQRLSFGTSSRGAQKNASAKTSKHVNKGHLIRPESEEEPLRLRPLDELDLDDFRINSEYNQGYDYAFTDVVRGKDERRCLSGCTDPSCCGEKFRKVVEMKLDFRQGRETTRAEDEEDERLLKDYLGTRYSRVQTMSKDEKHEYLVQAMTREMANKTGRHRHAYERRKSPPGFWRADFPTTQEQEEDRMKATEMTRSMVRERYLQAMRPNGAYKFRDE